MLVLQLVFTWCSVVVSSNILEKGHRVARTGNLGQVSGNGNCGNAMVKLYSPSNPTQVNMTALLSNTESLGVEKCPLVNLCKIIKWLGMKANIHAIAHALIKHRQSSPEVVSPARRQWLELKVLSFMKNGITSNSQNCKCCSIEASIFMAVSPRMHMALVIK